MKSFDVSNQQAEPTKSASEPAASQETIEPATVRPVVAGLAFSDETAQIRRHAGHDHKRKREHEHGAGCGCGPLRRHSDGHGVIGLEGGEVDHDTERVLRASAGSGSALAPALRTPLEGAFGADFGNVRLHTGAQATSLNRGISAEAFTYGQDIYFRDGLPDTGTTGGLHLLAHELTHTMQQGAVRRTVQRKAVVGHANDAVEIEADRVADTVVHALRSGADVEGPVVADVTADDGIHRHSAYEHYLLGELQPRQIKDIPSVREVAKNKEQKKRVDASVKKGEPKGLQDADKTNLDTVEHLIDREMERLLKYRKNPDALNARIGEKGEVNKGGATATEKAQGTGLQDDEYQVPIVVLSCAGGEKLVVSYSEMNTMPDLFGNPEAIQKTPKPKVLGLLQGVRQQLYIELSNIRKELFGDDNNQLDRTVGWDADFQDARGPRAQAVNDGAYEIRMESQVNSDTSRPGEEHEQYFAALERNACHFAPASWQQWRAYHEKARGLARASSMAKAKAKTDRQGGASDKDVEGLEQLAKDYANDAMIQNSFGEHYLQDSFAAGHLIDKTKIMQWFTQWADKDKGGMGNTASAKAGWSMALHAANSDLKSNPQMLHDKGVRGQLKGPQGAAAEIGMDVDDQSSQDIVLMMRWRALAQAKADKRTLTLTQAATAFGKPVKEVEPLLEQLVSKRFAEKDEPWGITKKVRGAAAQTKYILKKEMVNVLGGGTERRGLGGNVGAHVAYSASRGHGELDDKGKNTGQISGDEAEAAAGEFNLASYNNMLSNAYVGAATKHFHDMFCKQGLVVKTGENVDIGRIYGDSNMLNAGGQLGVEYSAETSRMSRDTIFDLINNPKAVVPSTDEIQKRFPTKVYYNGDKAISLVDFNKELELIIKDETKWLNPASSNKARMGYKVMDGISGKGALDVAALSQDPAHRPF